MKKFLSLVLALVMTMSLVTISAGAADFTDDASINYKEAVDVMEAINVIDGYTDGGFGPQNGLSRGAAAKIICNMILGPTTASALPTVVAPFKDVAAGSTYAGYIAYCAEQGIINGYADGTFQPGASLSGYAFMKMLLGALGYDAVQEGYTGNPNWKVNVAKQAIGIGLAKGLKGDFDGQKHLNREEAMLYAFNTLKAPMVEYKNNSTINVGNVTIETNSKATVITEGATSKIAVGSLNKLEFAEKYFTDLQLTTGSDPMGRPTNKWYLKSDVIGNYAKAVSKTLVVADKDKNLQYFLESSVYGDYTLSEVLDDAGTDATNISYNGVVRAYNGSNLNGDGYLTKGDVIECFYDTTTGKLTDVVVGHYVFAEIDAAKTNMTSTEKNNGASYRIKLVDFDGNSLVTGYDKYDDATKILTGFDAATYVEDATLAVAQNASTKRIVDSYVIEAVTGTPTAAKGEANGYITIDGTKYNYAGTPDGTYTGFNFERSYDVYATAEGYAIAIEGVSIADVANVYYVTSVYSDTVGGEVVYYAQRVALDGTVENVRVELGALQALDNDADFSGGNAFEAPNADIAHANSTGWKGLYTFADVAVDEASPAVKQKAGNGVYTMKAAAADTDITVDYVVSAVDNADKDIDRADTSFTHATAGKVYINSATKLLAVKGIGGALTATAAEGSIYVDAGGSSDYYVITTKKDTKTAVAIVVASSTLTSSGASKDMLYQAAESKDQVGYKKYSTTLYAMADNSEIAATITKEFNGLNAQGFYTYEMKGEDYSLSAYSDGALANGTFGTGVSATTDKAEGYVNNIVIDGVYEDDGKYLVSGAVGAITLDDAAVSGLLVIDNRTAAAIDASIYNEAITTIADLKSAVKAGGSVTADIYYNDAVTFIAVDNVGGGASAPAAYTKGDKTWTNADDYTNVQEVAIDGTDVVVSAANDKASNAGKYVLNDTVTNWNLPAETDKFVVLKINAPSALAAGATVTIDGKYMTETPHTWSDIVDGGQVDSKGGYVYMIFGLKSTDDTSWVSFTWGDLGTTVYNITIE